MITRPLLGQYGDVDRDVSAWCRGTLVMTDRLGDEQAWPFRTTQAMWIRVASNGARLCVGIVDGSPIPGTNPVKNRDRVLVSVDGAEETDLGHSHGAYAVEVAASGDGFLAWAQTAGTRIDAWEWTPAEGWKRRGAIEIANSSFGIWDHVHGQPLLTDEVRDAPDLRYPTEAGRLRVGQRWGVDALINVWQGQRYVALEALAYEPRVAQDTDGTYRVLSPLKDRHEVIEIRGVPPFGPLEAAPPVEQWEPAEAIVADVWPYLVGRDEAWPRTGTHRMDRVLQSWGPDQASAWFVKFGDGRKWERWALDGEWVYHVEDHINDTRGVCYEFGPDLTHKRWLKRRMAVGERLVLGDAQHRFYRDGAWRGWTPLRRTMTLLSHEVERNSGRKRIHFTYDPGSGTDTIEHYLCDTVLGWFSWWEVNQATAQIKGQVQEWRAPLVEPLLMPEPGRVPWPPVVATTVLRSPRIARVDWRGEWRPGDTGVFAKWEDSQNPQRFEVGIDPRIGLYIEHELTTGAGFDRTGSPRPVRIICPELPPPVPPDNPCVPDVDRETFLQEVMRFPSQGTHREALGYAWARMVDRWPSNDALNFVWPGSGDSGGSGGDPVPGPGGPMPSREVVRAWRGNFLANGLEKWGFMYPSWDDARRRRFREHYRARGWTHLPIGVWGAYDNSGDPPFDFHDDIQPYRWLLLELLNDGLIPCVFAHTDAVPGWGPLSRDRLERWAADFLPQIADLVPCWCTGWEGGQIDEKWSGRWMGNGKELIAWARTMRSILGRDALIYVHFPPERITGYPNYPNHDGPQDEPGWWQEVGDALDGLLYQRAPDEDERWTIAHAIGGKSADGSTDMGDARRIAGGAWGVHKDFVFFEAARDPERWARLIAAVKGSPFVKGWC